MGFNVLKASPFSSTKSILFTTTPPSKSRTFAAVVSRLIHCPPTSLSTSRLTSSSIQPVARCNSSSGFFRSLRFEQSDRRFRGGVVVSMAAGPGSVKKTEEEWRAVLSPEQFRILRQKGTDLHLKKKKIEARKGD